MTERIEDIHDKHVFQEAGSTPDEAVNGSDVARWFVMRDLKRANALDPAYKRLAEAGMEIFTPMKWQIRVHHGRRERVKVPFVRDLLFLHGSRSVVDNLALTMPLLQYRYVKGAGYRVPMVVPDWDMNRFIKAVNSTDNPRYYLPGEVTPEMMGKMVRIVGGNLDGYEARLLSARGTRKRRLLVNLPGCLVAAVEVVSSEFVEIAPPVKNKTS